MGGVDAQGEEVIGGEEKSGAKGGAEDSARDGSGGHGMPSEDGAGGNDEGTGTVGSKEDKDSKGEARGAASNERREEEEVTKKGSCSAKVTFAEVKNRREDGW